LKPLRFASEAIIAGNVEGRRAGVAVKARPPFFEASAIGFIIAIEGRRSGPDDFSMLQGMRTARIETDSESNQHELWLASYKRSETSPSEDHCD
jgi:hypothetical protein